VNKALFLDRDGTIIKEAMSTAPEGDKSKYLTTVEKVELIEGADLAIAYAKESGYKVIVITNQSAIARGWLTEETLELVNQRMYNLLAEHNPNAIIDDLYYSPYHVDGIIEKYKKQSTLRKPDIGMILEARKKHDINLSESYFIGDTYDDMKCGENAGTKRILVMTGFGEMAYRKCLDENLKIDFIASNLLEAVNFVLSH
jgi:D-glycero-D-manno-heptose 1,7-bisphosphate phosphatase